MSAELVLVFIVLGAFVGVMAGLLGIGGGGILVPVLTTIFIHLNFPMHNVVHIALGTSMACIMVTSLSSLRAHHANSAVVWSLVKVMSPAIIAGTFLATFLAAQISSKALAIFFSIFMAYVASQMFRNKKIHAGPGRAGKIELSLVALGIGAISALVSIGGGSLTVPYLTWRNMDIRKAIGTSAALGFPIAVTGTLGYLINGILSGASAGYTWGFVYVPAVLLVTIPSFFTAPIGARLTQKLPVQTLKRVFGVLLIVLSIKMLVSLL
ncbi:MAG: sulfite exporter TauE/SafE family protein [Methylotenera sp.]